jgi:shikimate kinase
MTAGGPARGDGVVLVGGRGAGKSTVGRRVAALLGRRFVDIDAEVERREGRTVAALFSASGEAGFREAEAAAVEAVEREAPGAVVATGGGAVLRASNREALRRMGQVVWLRADAAVLGARLARGAGGRPSLTGRGVVEELAEVLAAREGFYAGVADVVVDAAGGLDEVARAVVAAVAAPGRRGEPA